MCVRASARVCDFHKYLFICSIFFLLFCSPTLPLPLPLCLARALSMTSLFNFGFIYWQNWMTWAKYIYFFLLCYPQIHISLEQYLVRFGDKWATIRYLRCNKWPEIIHQQFQGILSSAGCHYCHEHTHRTQHTQKTHKSKMNERNVLLAERTSDQINKYKNSLTNA